MEHFPKNQEQCGYPPVTPDEYQIKQSVESKPLLLDECQKSMTHLNINENDTDNIESLNPADITVVFPINPWTFWYRNPSTFHETSQWENSLIKIETVHDVDHLWKVLNHVVQPSFKTPNANMFVFKENSAPAWEHKSNENAGRWVITLNDNHNLHNTWNNMVLQVIGDTFANVVTDINGIGLDVKPVFSKITVWTTKTTIDNYKNIIEIGVMCRKAVGPMTKFMFYVMHNQIISP